MVRLIISDIDGTLVPEGCTELNPEYIEVIRKLTDRGVHFAVASGRQASSIDAVFQQIRDRIYYVGDNGASIQQYGKLVKEVKLCPEDTLGLIEDARKIEGCYLLLSTKDGFFMDTDDKDFQHLVFNTYKGAGAVVENVGSCAEDCIKISLYCCKRDPHEVRDLLYEKWKDRFAIHVSGTHWIDLNAFEASKGNAARYLQEKLGVSPEETVAFGDNFNDISMLEQAGRSYASVLSHPDVKAAARYEVASYEEDGVLQVLKQILEEVEDGE
jgi:hypothetical protein